MREEDMLKVIHGVSEVRSNKWIDEKKESEILPLYYEL
jgi:hypothetical protein